MGKTLKFVIIGLVALALVAGVAVLVGVSQLDRIVVAAVEKIGSETLGTKVTLNGANISLSEGIGALHGLNIANPEGFSAANAFELDEISVDLEIGSLGSDEIVIESVVVDGARILFEETGGQINLQKLIPKDDGSDSEETVEMPKLVIKEFRFTNARTSLSSEKLKTEKTLQIPDMVLHDIGRKGAGLTAAEAGNQLLRPVIQKVIEEAAKEGMVDTLKEKATSKIMDLFGGRKKEE